MTRPSRVSRARVLELLRLAARKGDRAALTLALDQMKTLAYTPRYWDKYLDLIGHPMARLADLLAIKQGDKIAHQKGWTRPKRERSKVSPKASTPARGKRGTGRKRSISASQPSLFPDF
jgi:hypothetical protein